MRLVKLLGWAWVIGLRVAAVAVCGLAALVLVDWPARADVVGPALVGFTSGLAVAALWAGHDDRHP